jgi:hypothetical protein
VDSVSATPLIPQAFWFRLAIPCVRVEGIPKPKGGMLDLPQANLVPHFAQLDGKPTWAIVKAGWNPRGLGVSIEVSGKISPLAHDPFHPEICDRVHLWIDTRDSRTVHRATKFCHHFSVELIPSKRGPEITAQVSQHKIPRAQADSPQFNPASIQARAEPLRKGWRLELFFPAQALHGFDAEVNRRLGFYHQVTDADRGDQFLAIGRDFPIGEDPSLWCTLELRDA